MSVALVTDSTAYLPAEVAAAAGVTVVPLHVAADGSSFAEGDLEGESLVRLVKRSRTLTTSRPSPRVLHEVYETLADQGASAIVSVHLSGELSGTCDAATLAARAAAVPVRVVDSRTMGMTLGHAVLSGAETAARGGDVDDVVETVRSRAQRGSLYFYVHTLEYLRRGGRIGNAAAFLGSALAVRPLLKVVDGRIEPLEKVRTSSRALGRLADLIGEEAERVDAPVEVAVHHLGDDERALRLAGGLSDRLGPRLHTEVLLRPIGAVAAAHLGPGAVAVALSPVASPAAQGSPSSG